MKRSGSDILTWSLSFLQRNLGLTSLWLPLLNQLQTHLSAAADWPSLRRTKSPTGGQRCWVSVISRPGKICCLVHLLFNGIDALLSQGCTPVCLANFTVTTDRLFLSPLCVFAKRDSIAKYIKPLDLVKCWLKCLLALVATKQLLSVHLFLFGIRPSCPPRFLSHDRHSTR